LAKSVKVNIINTHNLKADFGKWKGELYTRLPVSYLTWMVNSDHSRKHIAQAELTRRGTTMPTLELSGHAIDRASQILLDIWIATNKQTPIGFHSWLLEVAEQVWDEGMKQGDDRYWYGFKWCFEGGEKWPVLKTVIKNKFPQSCSEDK
jgi:uncharacterized protein (DUF3820 family)